MLKIVRNAVLALTMASGFASAAYAGDIVTPRTAPATAPYDFITLQPGDAFSSADGRFRLVYQTDGNFVLYQGATSLWSANTTINTGSNGYSAQYVRFQHDGNLVVYNAKIDRPATPVAVWSSKTSKYTGATLTVQNDGNVTIKSTDGTVRWQTGTCCH